MLLFKFWVSLICIVFLLPTTLEYEYISIVNLDRKPIIEGQLNGQKAFFLVDTGSDLSFLHIDDKEAYNFSPRKKFKSLYLTGMGGRVNQIAQVRDAKLKLGSQFIYTGYMTCDLSDIIESMQKTTGITINGIIGSYVMKNYLFKIDYETQQIGIAIREKQKEIPSLISKDMSSADIW